MVPCGKCVLCRKKRANDWRIRLMAEAESEQKIRHSLFLTFTFNDKEYPLYLNPDNNGKSRKGDYIRRWRQNFKNKYGYSPRYFLIEDCGSQFGRIHLHGFLFNPPNVSITQLRKDKLCWNNGFVQIYYTKSLRAVSYVCGYITGSSLKSDAKKHGKPVCDKARKFVGKIFVSKGIGSSFAEKFKNEYRKRTKDHFAIKQGPFVLSMPRYLRTKIWNDSELDWIRNDYLIEQYKKFLEFDVDNYRVPFNGKMLSSQHFKSVSLELVKQYENLDDTIVLYDSSPISILPTALDMPENLDFYFEVPQQPIQQQLKF